MASLTSPTKPTPTRCSPASQRAGTTSPSRSAASDKAAERAALAGLTENLADGLAHLPDQADAHPLFARVAARWDDDPESVRRLGVAYDITLVHLASLSNLVAALGWLLVDLLEHPDELLRVRAGDRTRVEQCALESTRMAQRSIMSRHTLSDTKLDVAPTTLTVEAGVTIATLLPLTNTTAAPDLASWDPDRWHRRRLVDAATLPAPELVTTFGHGHHTCPAQPFSLAAMTETALTFVETYDLVPGWSAHPLPVPAQIGGVARAASPCPLAYRRRN
jgi:cytochrome P450